VSIEWEAEKDTDDFQVQSLTPLYLEHSLSAFVGHRKTICGRKLEKFDVLLEPLKASIIDPRAVKRYSSPVTVLFHDVMTQRNGIGSRAISSLVGNVVEITRCRHKFYDARQDLFILAQEKVPFWAASCYQFIFYVS
jgi:hypothetical protein